MGFHSDRQRKAAFANMNRGRNEDRINNSSVTVQSGFRRIRVTKETKKEDVDRFVSDNNFKTIKKNRIRAIKELKQTKEFKNLNVRQKTKLNDAFTDLRKAKTKGQLVQFVRTHKAALTFMGIGIAGGVGLGAPVFALSLPVVAVVHGIETIKKRDSDRSKEKIEKAFKSDKDRKEFFGNRKSNREVRKPKPTFKILKVKGQAFVQRTIITKKAKIVQRRPI